MKYLLFLCLLTGYLFADCRGCCSHHGGVVCRDGVTMCADGTPLSTKCASKGCNVCGTSHKPRRSKWKRNTEHRVTPDPKPTFHRINIKQGFEYEILIKNGEKPQQITVSGFYRGKKRGKHKIDLLANEEAGVVVADLFRKKVSLVMIEGDVVGTIRQSKDGQTSDSVFPAPPRKLAPAKPVEIPKGTEWQTVRRGDATYFVCEGKRGSLLLIRCVNNKLNVSIDTKTTLYVLDPFTHVSHKVDGKFRRGAWPVSTDHKTAFSNDPEKTIKRIMNQKVAEFLMIGYDGSTIYPYFTTIGLKETMRAAKLPWPYRKALGLYEVKSAR